MLEIGERWLQKVRSLSLQKADRFEGAISMFRSVPDRLLAELLTMSPYK